MYQYYNPSPVGARVGDCAVRAVAKALGMDWETGFAVLTVKAYETADLPNSNAVINAVLTERGFERGVVPNTCPACYTFEQFAADYPEGTYVLGTGTHVATVIDGILFDTWDSSKETPIYYWVKKEG